MKRFCVVDQHGAGWGRFDTREEAEAHASGLEAMNPQGFVVAVIGGAP